jgi:hypothetical protein
VIWKTTARAQPKKSHFRGYGPAHDCCCHGLFRPIQPGCSQILVLVHGGSSSGGIRDSSGDSRITRGCLHVACSSSSSSLPALLLQGLLQGLRVLAGDVEPRLGFGRIVVSEMEAPKMFVDLV